MLRLLRCQTSFIAFLTLQTSVPCRTKWKFSAAMLSRLVTVFQEFLRTLPIPTKGQALWCQSSRESKTSRAVETFSLGPSCIFKRRMPASGESACLEVSQ